MILENKVSCILMITVRIITMIIIIIIIITLFKPLIVLAEHECSTNWEDCKPNESNQINESNKSIQIKLNVDFRGEGKTGVPGEKPLGAE